MSLKDQLKEDMKAAMKAREEGKTALSVIRMVNSAIKNTEIILEEIRWRNYRKEKFKKQKDIESSVYNYRNYCINILNCITC